MLAFNPLNNAGKRYPKQAVDIQFAIHDGITTFSKQETVVDREDLINILNAWKRYANRQRAKLKVEIMTDWINICEALIEHLQVGLPTRELFIISDEKEMQGIAMAYQNKASGYLISGLLTAPWNLMSRAMSSWNFNFFSETRYPVQYKNIGSAMIAAIIDHASTKLELEQVTLYAGTTPESSASSYYKNRLFESGDLQKQVLHKKNFMSFAEAYGLPQHRQGNYIARMSQV